MNIKPFTKEDYFANARNYIRGVYMGFPGEETSTSEFRKEPAIIHAKIIVDGFDYLINDCGFRDLPADLYAELEKNVTFIRSELDAGRCPEDRRDIVEESLKKGERLLN